MRKGGLLHLLMVAVAVLSLSFSAAYGQAVYSYVDENGVRVLTNIPPKNPELFQNLPGADANSSATIIKSPDRGGVRFVSNRSKENSNPLPRAFGAQTVASATAHASAPSVYAAVALEPIIDKYADEFRLDPSLIRSMIAQESGFNPKAVSRKGAQGLMQLMPATAARVGVKNAFDPEENIRGGMKHMRNLLDLFENDLVLSLAAYNAGENLVQRIGRVPNIAETHNYVRSITGKYGSKKLQPQVPRAPDLPATFRFIDENGVINLTNIPPIRRNSGSDPAWAASGQSLQ